MLLAIVLSASPNPQGSEIQSEYFVKSKDFKAALTDLFAIRNSFIDLVQITEIRPVHADGIPMSPAKHHSGFFIHFTWLKEPQLLTDRALPIIESTLRKYDAMPHLGKLFCMSGYRFEQLY